MHCHWLIKGTQEWCSRPTKKYYCGVHTFAIKKRGCKPPKQCISCGNGTNSVTELCMACGQHKMRSKLWREREKLNN